MNGKQNISVMDSSGNTATIATYDVRKSNGVCFSFAAKLSCQLTKLT